MGPPSVYRKVTWSIRNSPRNSSIRESPLTLLGRSSSMGRTCSTVGRMVATAENENPNWVTAP